MGSKSGSKALEDTIKQYNQGKISEDEVKQAIEKYKEGQNTCVDVVADIASGILAVGAFALAVPTGGASLAVGLGMATAVCAGVKVGIKAGDAINNNKEYSAKDLLYDTATGGINGLLSPVTNGLGNCVTKTIGKKLGLKIVQEGAEEAAEQIVKQGIKQAAKSAILTQSVDVAGGTIAKRAVALGAGMALDGALGGASDNMVRAVLNGENVLKAGVEGAIGGAIMSPIIGGGFRVAGNAGKALNNKITTSIVLPDGLNTKFKQGTIGDCALLSTIDGMMNNQNTAKNIKQSITKSIGGDYNVKIGDKVVKVAKSSLSDEMLSDTTGIKIFEQAYKQLTGDIDGGFAEVVAKQFGLNPVHIANDSITDELLDTLAKNQGDTVLSFGTLVDTNGSISDAGQRHYFTIKNIDPETKKVTLTSPIDTSKPITLSYDEIKAAGISIDGGSINKIDLPNSVRDVSEGKFYSAPNVSGEKINFEVSGRTISIDKQDYQKVLGLLKNSPMFETCTQENVQEVMDDIITKIIRGEKISAESFNITVPELQKIKGLVYPSLGNTVNIDINGRQIALTQDEFRIFSRQRFDISKNPELMKKYCAQLIESDAMFIEALAIYNQIDVNNKTTSQLFQELQNKLLTGDDLLAGSTISIKKDALELYFIRDNHTKLSTDTLKLGKDNYGADNAVHEITKNLAEIFESDMAFQKSIIEYCQNSSKFKNFVQLGETYRTRLRKALGADGIGKSKKVEDLISNKIDNEIHLIFRALQRDSLISNVTIQPEHISDTDSCSQSFIDIIASSLQNEQIQNTPIIPGTILDTYGTTKFHTILFDKGQKWWQEECPFVPQIYADKLDIA